jgi:hypothetical protein
MSIELAVEVLEARDVPAAAFQNLPVLPFSNTAVIDHARAIFALGQQLGRRSDTFARFGDSNSSTYSEYGQPQFPYLNPMGDPSYNPATTNLAESHPELLGTWQLYHNTLNGAGQNSFSWIGPGAWGGYSTANVIAALGSVIATSDPSVALIMIGTNELPGGDTAGFTARLTQVVQTLVSQGIVPILSTVPPYQGYGGIFANAVPPINQVIANVAATERVPLWNFWRVTQTLPFQGIYQDPYDIHLTISPNGAGSFLPADMIYAQNNRNLEALQILNWFQTQIAGGRTNIPPRPPWQALPTSGSYYSVGRDIGVSPTVDVYDSSGNLMDRFQAFGGASVGGVRVATGDLNGDGFADVVCATGAGTPGQVEIFSGQNRSVLRDLVPFGRGYTGGLSVAVGDVNGAEDLVVGKASGGSAVRVYQDHGGSWTLVSAFHALTGGGVDVAVANVAGRGPEIALGSATSPSVQLFSPTGSLVSSFNVPGVSGGVTVAAADLKGDGTDELAVAATKGSNRVQVMNPVSGAVLASFAAGPVVDPSFGIRLGTLRKSTGTDTLLVGNAAGSPVSVRGFSDLTGTPTSLPPNNPHHAYGIFVG